MNNTLYRTLKSWYRGRNEYRFCRNDEGIGALYLPVLALHCIMPDYCSIQMTRSGRSLRCRHDPDMTLVPGISIPITAGESDEEFARIFWDGRGRHRLNTPWGNLQIVSERGEYSFLRDGKPIATTLTYRHDWDVSPAEQAEGWNLFRLLEVTEPTIPDELAVLMQCFPMLAIGP